MGLSCECYFDATTDDYDWIWHLPHDFQPWPYKRGRRCQSCGKMVRSGDDCGIIHRFRAPTNFEYERLGIDGDVEIGSYVWCEECAGLAFSLADLGYCFDCESDMRELVREHAQMHGTAVKDGGRQALEQESE